jgi:hypothetical protein
MEGANREDDMHTVRASQEQALPSMAVLVVARLSLMIVISADRITVHA